MKMEKQCYTWNYLKHNMECQFASLIFHQKLRKDTEAIGFKVNLYYPCVTNKMIRGKKMAITWHVDGLKVSHAEKYIFDSFIEQTKETYDNVTKINTSRDNIHEYLVVALDYTTSAEVKMYMKEYIDKIIEEFPYMEESKRRKSVKTPSEENVFTVNPNATNMDLDKEDVLHTTIDKALFICNRESTNIKTTVPLLCTIFKGTEKDECKKFLRMINYLRETRDNKLTLKINNTTITD